MNMQSDQVNELFTALAKAQGELKPAIKDTKNPFFKSNYADLNSVWEACRSQLSHNGLCVTQSIMMQETGHALVTILGHKSGQWIKSIAPIVCSKADAQGFGSAVTYQRRYALSAIVGVSTDDDDGERAVQHMRKTYADHPPKAVEEKIDLITPSQVEELKLLKMTATPEIQSKVDDILAKKNVKNFKELPATGFDYIKDLLLKNQKPDFILGEADE